MEEKDTSQSKEQSPPTQPQAESIETNGGVLAVKEETRGRGGVMEEKDTSQSKEQSPPTEPQAESIETNGGVLAVKEETAEAISESTEKDPAPQSNEPKKRGALQLVRAAMFMLRRRSDKKSKSVHVEVPSKNLLRRAGSMRPLHMPQPALTPPPSAPKIEDCHLLQPSPLSSPFSSSSSSTNSTCRYASAPNLQELGRRAGCNSDDDIDPIDEFINNGDEMIDVKAEEFIANFYKQMRLQRH